MADSLLTMTLGVGASLVKVLLQANGCVTEANFVEVAKEGFGILSWWMNRGGDADGQLAKQIAEILAKKTRDMYEVYRAQGIDEEQLGGVVTEVEILFNKVVENDELLLLAVNDPDSFSEVLQDDIRQRRKNIESRLEPYFDKLVKAAVDEYVKLAPWSPKFQIEALKYISDNVCKILGISIEILENSIKGLEKLDYVTKGMDVLLERGAVEVASKVSVQYPIIFGRRPDVADSYYIEREEQVRLRNLIKEDSRLRVVLVGMHGCGKSQLTSDLAQWCEKQEWSLVAWINAASRESTKSDLVELAQRLPIDRSDKPTQDQLINRCLDYFKSANATDRLIIFDNVEDINDLTGLVPRGDGLRVVVTTTDKRGWRQQSWKVLELGVFSRKDSIKCLLRITDSKDREAANAVAQKLGDLPLAIVQAGATACEEDWTLKKYLVRLKRYSSSIVIKRVRGDAYTEGVSNALFMAVDVALDKLGGDEREVARRQLGGLAVLAQSGVPTRWIDPLSYNADQEENNPDIADENAHSALTGLVKMSVVQQSADDGKSLTMLHRLQAQVLRENWGKGKTATHEEAFDAAVEILSRTEYEQLPSKATHAWRREISDLIAQLSAIAIQDYSRLLFKREQVRSYLNRAFNYADDLGLVYEAVELDVAVAVVEDVLGPDHPDTLTVRNNLAGAYDSVGRFGEAIDAWEELLPDCERVLGPDHPVTLTVRNNLAGAYKSAGRFGEAIELFERVLAECECVLGADHPDTLTVRNNLAVAYKSAGRFGEAIELFEQVLAERERVLGPDHPDTLNTRNNLVHAYDSTGPLAEVIDACEELLLDCQRVLGADHPDTLNIRNNLAHAYKTAGRFSEAIELYEQVLAECERLLGADHPDSLNTRNSLADAYGSVERFAEAIDAWEELLPDCERVLGPDHRVTLNTRNNLALAYRSVGRFGEAIDAWEELLPDCERVLGPDHRVTLTVRNDLAGAYRSVGRFGETVDAWEELLPDCQRVLGPDHPDTLAVRNHLALAYRSVGRFGEVIELYEQVLAERERLLGADHPVTLAVRNNLASAYESAGRLAEAIDAWEELLPNYQRVLGLEHPLTKLVQKSLEAAKRKMNPPDAPSPETGED